MITAAEVADLSSNGRPPKVWRMSAAEVAMINRSVRVLAARARARESSTPSLLRHGTLVVGRESDPAGTEREP